MAKRIRFHLDEHIDPDIAAALRRHGIDVTSMREVGLRTADDGAQLEFARTQQRVIVTDDADFLRVAAHQRASGDRHLPPSSSRYPPNHPRADPRLRSPHAARDGRASRVSVKRRRTIIRPEAGPIPWPLPGRLPRQGNRVYTHCQQVPRPLSVFIARGPNNRMPMQNAFR